MMWCLLSEINHLAPPRPMRFQVVAKYSVNPNLLLPVFRKCRLPVVSHLLFRQPMFCVRCSSTPQHRAIYFRLQK